MKELSLLWKKELEREAMYNEGVLVSHIFIYLMDGLEGWCAISDTTIPRIQQFMPKKRTLATHNPGAKVDLPRNSSMYPCCSHRAYKESSVMGYMRQERGIHVLVR